MIKLLLSSPLLCLGLSAQFIAPGGVVNAADYTDAIAPGSIISIFGTRLASETASASGTPLPLVIGATLVEANNLVMPLFFISPGQINAQMPYGLIGPVEVRVRWTTGVTPAVTVNVVPRAPRFFTRSMDGQGDPILLHGADWKPVSPAAPPVEGEVLIAFLTGFGAVSPPIASGRPADGQLYEVPPGDIEIAFGGKPATVLFAGLAPGFIGLGQVNFRVPAGATDTGVSVAVARNAPASVSVVNSGSQTVGSHRFSSSSKLKVAWEPPAYAVDHYEVVAAEGIQNTSVTTETDATTVELRGLKAATSYTITVKSCADPGCTRSGTSFPVSAETFAEYWQLQGAGNTTAGLSRIVSDGNVRISATRFGPEAGPVTGDRIQLYYGPMGQPGQPQRQTLTTAITNAPVSASLPSSYLSFTSSRSTTGLITPSPAAPLVETVATGQGVPLSAAMGGKVRLFFEAQGADRRTRIFTIDSVDGYVGQDFNAGSPTTCSTTADYSASGGCTLTQALSLEGDRIQNTRQNKVGFPVLTDWRWDGAPGTFMVFTTDMIPGCSNVNMNHGYAVWDGTVWRVQYAPNGCPKLFTSAQAMFPMHTGGTRYKAYYGNPSITVGRLPGNLPFLGPKRVIYADGAVSGSPNRVDFEDWEPQSWARDVIFLWPNGDQLNDTAEGYIDDYHFLAPTGNMDLQVMYLAITNGTEVPFASAAVLLNP